jgi:hypothetical protein
MRAGGILNTNASTTTIDSSTISGNHAQSGGGGGLQNEGMGGGSAPTVTVTNSTVANNTASGNGGAIDNFDSTASPPVKPLVTLVSSTVAGNSAGNLGGGLLQYQSNYNVRNSLIAQNAAVGGSPDCRSFLGSDSYSSQGYNLVGDTTGCNGFSAGKNDLTGVNPLVGALGAYGGPTQTIPLVAGSPALHAGNPATPGSGGNACPTNDQRALPRGGAAGRCDIGAVQPGPPSIAITTPANNGKLAKGQKASAAYSCTADKTTTVSSCAGTVAIGKPVDTATLGLHMFTVTATDTLGANATKTNTYTVVKPVITGASFAKKKFRATKGTKLRLTLDEDATVQVVVTQKVKGHKVRGNCNPKATTGNLCKKSVRKAKLMFTGKDGRNVFTFHPRKLKIGKYTATIIAIDAAGDKSSPITLKFTIK